MSINVEIFTAKEQRLRGTRWKGAALISLEVQGAGDNESVTIDLNPEDARELARWLTMQADLEAR